MESYEPPILDVESILCTLKEFLDIKETDISRPDPRRWRSHYGGLFEMITDVSIEQSSQSLCRTMLLQSSSPEIYEEGFAQMCFTLCIQRVFMACGYENFSVEDVITPKTQRLIKMLSAYINFSLHSGNRRIYFDEVKESLERSKERAECVKNRDQELRYRLEKAEAGKESRQGELQQLREERDKKLLQIKEMKSNIKRKQNEMNSQNVLNAEKDKEKENLKQKIGEVQAAHDNLSKKIVHSPARFKQEKEKLLKRQGEIKRDLIQKEQKLSENRCLLDKENNSFKAAKDAVKLCTTVKETLQNENDVDDVIKKLQDNHNELLDKSSELMKKQESLVEMLSARSDQKRQFMIHSDENKQGKHSKLNEYKDLKDTLLHVHNDIKSKGDNVKEETLSLQNDIKNVRQGIESQKVNYENEFEDITNKMKALHNQVMQATQYSEDLLKKN